MKNESLLPASWTRPLVALVAVAIVALLSSCAHFDPLAQKATQESKPQPKVAEKKPPPGPMKPPPPSRLYEWYGSNEYVSHIEISINEQKARFYSGDKQVGWTTIASGIQRYPTPVGTFAVLEKVQNKKSNLYGRIYNKEGKLIKRNAKMGVHPVPAGGYFKGASMPYFLRLTNDGIGLHAGPIPRPGNRASHGCIRMPKNLAPILYRYVDIGTPVTIKGNGPSYSTYVAKQRRSAPKPVSTAVAKADPPPAQDTPVAPGSGTADHQASEQSATTSDVTAVAPQHTAAGAPPSPGAALPIVPVPSAASVPANAPDDVEGTVPSENPMPTSAPRVPGVGDETVKSSSDTGATTTAPVAPATDTSSNGEASLPSPTDSNIVSAPAAAPPVPEAVE